MDYELTDDLTYFQSKDIPKIAYTNTIINEINSITL